MKDVLIVIQWCCWRENDVYTRSEHYTVYKLNVISQCSSVTAYLVTMSLFYQENSFTQLIQVFTFKNEPDSPSVQYKLENYIVGVKISWKNNLKKRTFYKSQSYYHQGPVLKHLVIFYINFLFSCTTPTHYNNLRPGVCNMYGLLQPLLK